MPLFHGAYSTQNPRIARVSCPELRKLANGFVAGGRRKRQRPDPMTDQSLRSTARHSSGGDWLA
jgi:hypothetical protein